MKKTILFLTFVLLVNMCFADTIVMLDGMKYDGKVIRDSDGVVMLNDGEGIKSIERKKIAYLIVENEIEVGGEGAYQKAKKYTITSIVPTAEGLKQQEFLYYLNSQNVAKDIDEIKSIMAWEFGIVGLFIVAGVTLYALQLNK